MDYSNYFDYAAATPICPEVSAAMMPYFSQGFYNPSAGYLKAKAIKDDIKNARQQIASIVGVKPIDVIFTAGGTEANNLALKGIKDRFPEGEILISAVEHDSILEPAKSLGAKVVPVLNDGTIDLRNLESSITDNTLIVSIIMANNETGMIQPLKKISDLISKKRAQRLMKNGKLPLLFHSDASQAGNSLSLNFNTLGLDMMTINGGKIYGPKQSGALITKYHELKPLIEGGGQESGYRSGTENVANIVGLSKALLIAQQGYRQENKRLLGLRNSFINQLSKKVPAVIINKTKHQMPGIISLTVPGIDNEKIMMQLDELGFQVAVGSACSASDDEPSHVLKAIGLTDEEAQSTLRISLGRYTENERIDDLVNHLAKLVS